jgi:butyryl-CoA dehydrogenase
MADLLSARDIEFLLYELLDVEALCAAPAFAGHDRTTFDAALDAAARLAREQFAPHAATADMCEPSFDGTRVTIIPEVGEALARFADAGFLAAPFAEDQGGFGMPWVVYQACQAWFSAANVGTHAYAFLTVGVANLLSVFGSDDQKRRYLPSLLTGRFFGTMCLSEPQAGSSLADVRTSAEPAGDGAYRITGTKMWISGGEHELSESIVHLVLARLPDAPPGVKGISLFIVPKHRIGADGEPGDLNHVALAGLNHKMGYRGTVNTVLNFGEGGECRGELVGEPHQGLRYMFHMMNEARVGVGAGAATLGYAAYLHALEYARERPQGRLPGNKDPLTSPVPLIEHADVRRMLLTQKCFVEGGLALVLYCARLVDERRIAATADETAETTLLLELLTPVAKSWPSEFCLEANKLAIQVLGGYGYTRDYPVERLYRDNRLNAIHEGTHGIQALDLLGRKVFMDGGAAMGVLMSRIRATMDRAAGQPDLGAEIEALGKALGAVSRATKAVGGALRQGELHRGLANATAYLDMFGHIIVAWQWLEQASVASEALAAGSGEALADTDFYAGKLSACRFFFRHELPKIHPQADLIASLDDTVLGLSSDAF